MITALLILGALTAARWGMTLAVALLATCGAARAKAALLALARARDIDWCTNWLAPLHLVGLADRPSGRQMISSYVGKAAANGHRWARIAAFLIDMGAVALGDTPEHCERAWRHYQGLDQ